MTALTAKAWAVQYSQLVSGEIGIDRHRPSVAGTPLVEDSDNRSVADAKSAPRIDEPATDDPILAAALQELRGRGRFMRDGGRALEAALDAAWFQRVSTGYCSTDVRRVEAETAVLVDDGLVWAAEAGSSLAARHYVDPEFSLEHVSPSARDAFARVHDVFMGQYFLFGRAKYRLGLTSGTAELDRRMTLECVAFVLAHEVGHVMAGHRAGSSSTEWLTKDGMPEHLHAYGPEIEADAIAVQLLLGDMWGRSVAQAEVELRLLAMRLTMQALETVEQCALVPGPRRHLPVRRRWEGVLYFLHKRFPATTLDGFWQLWEGIVPSLTFRTASELSPPTEPASAEALRYGWVDPSAVDALKRWDDLEDAVWQYRQPAGVLQAVIGLEIGQLREPPVTDVPLSRQLGIAFIDTMLAGLPLWLVGGERNEDPASAGDLIQHLRSRTRWPEPFCSATHGVLPIHLVAAAVQGEFMRRLNATAQEIT